MSEEKPFTSGSLMVPFSERMKHPFLGSFITAFITLNWRVFIVIFSGDSASDRIAKVEKLLSESGTISHPLIVALGFTLLLPIADQLIQYWAHMIQTKGINERTLYSAKHEESEEYLFYRLSIVADAVVKDISELSFYWPQKHVVDNSLAKTEQHANSLFEMGDGRRSLNHGDVKDHARIVLSELSSIRSALKPANHDHLYDVGSKNTDRSLKRLRLFSERKIDDILRLADEIEGKTP